MPAVVDTATQYVSSTLSEASRLLGSGIKAVSDTVEGTEVYKRSQEKADQLAASWRWREAGWSYPGMELRMPLKTKMDERFMLSILGLSQALLSQSMVALDEVEDDGSSGFHLTSLLLPPATSSLILASLAVFFKPGGVIIRDVCLSPYCIIEKKQYARLFLSSFVHQDGVHLTSNLASAITPCSRLERRQGSELFLLELVALTAMSHGLYVGVSWFQKEHMGQRLNYYSVGAVGLSSICFAVQVVSAVREPNLRSSILGTTFIPARFMWPLQLAVGYAISPEASLVGHLCGVAAGLLQAYLVAPALSTVASIFPSRWSSFKRSPISATSGSAGSVCRPNQHQNRHGPSSAWLKETACQVSLFAAVVTACVVVGRHGGLKGLKMNIRSDIMRTM